MNKKSKKILIVDDCKEMRTAIKRLLSMNGIFEIIEAENGLEADEKIKNFIPELIILDVKMPEKDGYEICASIRANKDLDHLKIIGISGISGGIGEAFMNALGADAYFSKPFDNQKFMKKIYQLLNIEK